MKKKFIIIGVIVAVIVVAAIAVIAVGSEEPDIKYNYEIVSVDSDYYENDTEVTVNIRMLNNNLDSLSTSSIKFQLKASGEFYEGTSTFRDTTLAKGSYIDATIRYVIPDSAVEDNMSLEPFKLKWDDYTADRDTSMNTPGDGNSYRAEVEYNYTLSIIDSFTTTSGYLQKPSSGYQYVVLKYHIYNRSYSSGTSTNAITWQFKVSVDGVQYGSDIDMFSYPGYQLVDIPVGSDATSVQLFEIPSGHTVDELTVTLSIAGFETAAVNTDLAV